MKLAASNLGWAKEDDSRVYALLQRLGYEGLEIAPTRLWPEAPYEKLEEAAAFAAKIKADYGLTIPSMQSLWFGQSGSIFNGKEAARLADYTEKAYDFASAVGCPSLVFGCPRQRNVPEGRAAGEADGFFADLGERAAAKGVKLAMEANPPIYNTNYLNTTPQAAALVSRLQSPGLSVNLDIGTMVENGESVGELETILPLVSHIHISEPGLAVPVRRPLHKELADLLRKKNYQGFVSLEMKTADYDTVEQTLLYLKEVFG